MLIEFETNHTGKLREIHSLNKAQIIRKLICYEHAVTANTKNAI